MTRAFHVALGVLSLLAVATVIGLVIYSDAVSDFLFRLPTVVVIALIVGYPVLALLCVLIFGRAPAQADREISAALARREHPAVNLDLEVDVAGWEWPPLPEGVTRLPEREPAQIIQLHTGGTKVQ